MSDEEFPIVARPDYYIRHLDLSVEPEIGETILGSVGIKLNLSNPELDRDNSRFVCDCTLILDLTAQRGVVGQDVYESIDVGDIEVEMKIVVDPRSTSWKSDDGLDIWLSVIEEQIDIWEEDGYGEINHQFQLQLESEIMSDVLVPLSKLLETEFSGIIPRVLFEKESIDSQEAE